MHELAQCLTADQRCRRGNSSSCPRCPYRRKPSTEVDLSKVEIERLLVGSHSKECSVHKRYDNQGSTNYGCNCGLQSGRTQLLRSLDLLSHRAEMAVGVVGEEAGER